MTGGAGQLEPASGADVDAMTAQLGRPVRAVRAVAHRCGCGQPDVVQTEPQLTSKKRERTLISVQS